jgi:hypothetical protein
VTIEQDLAALRPEITRLLKQVGELRETQQTFGSRLRTIEETVQRFATVLDNIETTMGRSIRRST